MGIQASYRRLPSAEFEKLLRDPAYADTYFGSDLDEDDEEAVAAYREQLEESGRFLDIGKDWDALHFLATGVAVSRYLFQRPGDGDTSEELEESEEPEGESREEIPFIAPFINLVFGGTPTWWESGFGVIRFLTIEEVKELAEALVKIPLVERESRLNVRSFCDARVYPLNQHWSRHAIDLVPAVFDQLTAFVGEAAKNDEMILLALN